MMANIIGGYFTSHVPGIGGAMVRGDQETPYWKPFFGGYPPIREWLAKAKPDVAVVFSNDHGPTSSSTRCPLLPSARLQLMTTPMKVGGYLSTKASPATLRYHGT